MNVIFQDDPEAIQKYKLKLAKLEKEKAYWKSLKPEKRTFHNETDNMKRSYMLPLVGQNIRTVKKQLEKAKARQDQGITLERKRTFKDGKPRFYYKEGEF